MGKAVPYKLLGFDSSLDLALNMPDVVEVVELESGEKVLHGIPDEKTKELAGVIRSQMTNFSGFNYRTGHVLSRVRGEDLEKITKTHEGALPVSDYIKRKLKELIGQKVFGEEGLGFQEFRERFLTEAGHPLDIELFGFTGVLDFITFGVPELLELELDHGGGWRIVPVGDQDPRSQHDGEGQLVVSKLRNDLVKILEKNPYGLSVKNLLEYKRSLLGAANCEKLVEVALMSADICFVEEFQSELTFLPAGFSYGKSKPNFPLHRLGELKTQIRELVSPLKDKVSLAVLQRAMQGYSARLPDPAEFNCETFLDVLLLMPDVIKVSRNKDGSFMIQPRREEEDEDEEEEVTTLDIVQFPEDLVVNLRRVLAEYPGGVRGRDLAHHYRRITGQELAWPGYTNLASLLRDLGGRQGFTWEGERFSSSCHVLMLPTLGLADLPSGWVEITSQAGSSSARVVSGKISREIWSLESDMEEFYLDPTNSRRERLPARDCVVGQTVAAPYQGDISSILIATPNRTFPCSVHGSQLSFCHKEPTRSKQNTPSRGY